MLPEPSASYVSDGHVMVLPTRSDVQIDGHAALRYVVMPAVVLEPYTR